MREKARAAVGGLDRITPRGVTGSRDDGSRDYSGQPRSRPAMRILARAGRPLLVDGIVVGPSDIDLRWSGGGVAPRSVEPGSAVLAGALNLDGALIS